MDRRHYHVDVVALHYRPHHECGDDAGPHTYQADDEALPGWAARAKKAHYNAVENLAPFAGLVIVAQLAGAANAATAAAAIAYFWARVAHYVLYVSGVPFGRTLSFTVGWLAMVCIFWQIVT